MLECCKNKQKKGGDGLKKYNYFDDDEEDIEALIASFDIRKNDKKDDENEDSPKENTEAPKHKNYEKKIDKDEIIEAIKAFSLKSGEKIKTVAQSVREKYPLEDFDKISKNKKRLVTFILFIVFILIFAIMIAATVHSVNTENKRIAKFDADAGKVCSQYITKYGICNYENLYRNYGITGYRMTGLCYAREIDFDNDNVSELLLCYNDSGIYYVEVWGYNGENKFSNLYHQKATQTDKKSDDAWITIYANNNKYYIGVHDAEDITKVGLYTLKGDGFEKKNTCTYDVETQTFSIKKKEDYVSFERIRLAVLREEKAVVTTDLVTKTIESFSSVENAQAVAGSGKSIKSAYYTVVENYNQRYGKAKYIQNNGIAYIGGLAVVDLIDFDGDDTNELVLVYRKSVKTRDEDRQGNYIAKIEDKYYIEIYRYNGTKAVLAYKNEDISSSLNDSTDRYYIIKNKNHKAYYCANSFSSSEYARVINANSTILKFDGTKFVQQQKASYRTEYGYTEYFIDDKEVYKSTFNKSGYAVALFDGSSNYDENTFTVTYLQRRALKAGNMSKRVDKTIYTIKKLNPSYSGNTE